MLRFASTCPIRLPTDVRCQHQSILMAKSVAWKPEFTPIDNSAKIDSSSDEVKRVRLVSYNILAQSYVKSAFFPHSPPSCLRWKARSLALLDRLLSFNADLLCLQELDEFESFYKGQLEKHNFSSVYLKRPGKKKDGCGIFYKQSRLELIDKEFIHYNDLVPHANEGEEITNEGTSDTESDRGDPNDPKVRLKRDCVGILAAFRAPSVSETIFLLANTHIYWDPEWVDVKLAQVNYLIKCILDFKRKLERGLCVKIPVIICGDFNSQPGDQVYNYLVSGTSVERVTTDLSLDESLPVFDQDNSVKKCMLTLHSVYGSVQGEPAFTNCTPDFTGTLDYIFLSSMDTTKPVSLLQLPEGGSDDVVGGLPNHTHPSDHLPIGFDFIIHDGMSE